MNFNWRVVAAPMAGFSGRTYRDIVRSMGADAAYGEMISAKALIYQNKKTFELLDIQDEETPRIVQLFGSDAADMKKAAVIVAEHGAEIIDINMGCPVPKVVRNDEGAALMKQPRLAASLVMAAGDSGLPVSVKIRAGWDEANPNAVEFAKAMEAAGAALIAIHGRTKDQFYHGHADLDIIAQTKEALQIPVIGNGDITSPADAMRMLEQTNCDAVMIGRGMLGNPWLFADIKSALANQPIKGRPAPAQIIKLALEHLRQQIIRNQDWVSKREKNNDQLTLNLAEKLAVNSMRSILGHYIKGLPQSAALRREINARDSYQQIAELFTDYLEGQI